VGEKVKKGAKGIVIYCPISTSKDEKIDKDDDERMGCFPMSVFHVDDTEITEKKAA